MKRFVVLLLLASCGAFEAGSNGDGATPTNDPADSGPEGGKPTGPDGRDAGFDGGGDTGSPGIDALELVQLAEWHGLSVGQIEIPIPPASIGDLVVAVVTTDGSSTAPTMITPDAWSVVGDNPAGTMRATVLSHTIAGSEPEAVQATLTGSGDGNASVLVALYRGASAVDGAQFNAAAATANTFFTSAPRPSMGPEDMLFLVFAGATSTGDLGFSVPQGFDPARAKSYTMDHRGGVGASAAGADLPAQLDVFKSDITRTATSNNAVISTLVLVRN